MLPAPVMPAPAAEGPLPADIPLSPLATTAAQATPDDSVRPAENPPDASSTTIPRWPLYLIATVAVIAMLRWGESLFVPLLLGILLAYLLWPLVDRLADWRVPRVIGASLALALLFATLTGIGVLLADDVREVVSDLPQFAQRVRLSLRSVNREGNIVQKMRDTARELDRAAVESSAGPAAANRPPPPAAAAVGTSLETLALARAGQLVAGAAQAVLIVMLAFFILVSGDLFRRKLIDVAGPALGDKKEALRILAEIEKQLGGYLLQTLAINVLLGVAVWIAFAALGLAGAALWGVTAALLRFVPYVGTGLLIASSALAAFIQSASFSHALLVSAITTLLATVIGFGVSTWSQSRVAQTNATAIFLGLLFFGWLWGPWGILLGAPLVGICKLVFERIEPLKPVAVFLSR
ncbi:MAG: AI-2E family transporter [Burkholderiales bacterium]